MAETNDKLQTHSAYKRADTSTTTHRASADTESDHPEGRVVTTTKREGKLSLRYSPRPSTTAQDVDTSS